MLKKNKFMLIASTAVILLPIFIGLIFWNELPEKMATHWGIDGKADGWSSRGFAVFGLPLIFLAAHWFCVLVTSLDPKNRDKNSKIWGLVLWICPAVSVFAGTLVYCEAFGRSMDANSLGLPFIGLLFVIIGNYMPKCRQNGTVGIRVKWTLENEENWNASHRFGGKVWVIGGIFMMCCGLLPVGNLTWLAALVILIPLALAPIVYSYLYFRKNFK